MRVGEPRQGPSPWALTSALAIQLHAAPGFAGTLRRERHQVARDRGLQRGRRLRRATTAMPLAHAAQKVRHDAVVAAAVVAVAGHGDLAGAAIAGAEVGDRYRVAVEVAGDLAVAAQ